MSSITFNHAYPDHNNDITFKNKEVKVKICFQPPSCLKKTNIAKKSNTHFNPQRYGISSADRDNVSLWIQVLVKSLNRACDIYFMCIDILDRFLSKIKVSSSRQLKLIATACLFLSIKYLEDMDKVPKLSNIINHTGNIFSANDVKRMERIILEKLKYELCNMNCIDYLLKYVNALRPLFSAAATAALREGKQFVSPPDMNEIVRFSVNHLVISSRYEFLEYGPQQLALCALLISLELLIINDESNNGNNLLTMNDFITFFNTEVRVDEDLYCCMAELKYASKRMGK